MNKSPLVSVITPAFNSEAFIESTIRSVQAQSMVNWEQIVVDDCSCDSTVEKVRSVAEGDSRIKLITMDQNGGGARARNVAIEASRGRYIAFLDSDDLWEPEKLARQVAFMEKVGAFMSYTSYEKVDEQGVLSGRLISAPPQVSYGDLLRGCDIGCLTVIYDTQRIGKVFLPNIRRAQDYALWLAILRKGGIAHGLAECLAKYRERRGSVSSFKLRKAWYQWRVYRELERLPLGRSSKYFVSYAMKAFRKRRI